MTSSRHYEQRMDVVISRRKLRPLLFGSLALVAGAGIAVEVIGAMFHLKRRSGIVPLFSLSHEWNLPTLYTALLLVLCALSTALMAIGVRKMDGKFVTHWWVLTAGFTYIAIDEILVIHEAAHALPSLVAGPSLKFDGILHFAWVIPAMIVVLVVGLSFIPFLRHLPSTIRNGCLLSGAIYVGGAVGMELPLGWWAERMGTKNLGYALIDAVEESMEMFGLNLFLLVMLDQFVLAGVTLRFSSAKASAVISSSQQSRTEERPS